MSVIENEIENTSEASDNNSNSSSEKTIKTSVPIKRVSDSPSPKEEEEFTKELLELVAIQSHSTDEKRMFNWVRKKLSNIVGECIITTDEHGNIFFTKGKADIYPCIAAHLDTVHKITPGARAVTHDGKIYAYDSATGKRIGTGGDDKVGIFIALKIAESFDVVKCVLFSREEIGCVGSSAANLDFFNDCSFVIQADRRDKSDLIKCGLQTDLFSDEFEKALEPILKERGYRTCNGSSTDVVKLKNRGLNLCVFNASCGYYLPHTDKEYCVISEIRNCLLLFYQTVEKLSYRKWEHKFEKKVYNNTTYSNSNTHTTFNKSTHNTVKKSNLSTSSVEDANKKYPSIISKEYDWGKNLDIKVDLILDEYKLMLDYYNTDFDDFDEDDYNDYQEKNIKPSFGSEIYTDFHKNSHM